MYNMTFEEMIVVAKAIAYFSGNTSVDFTYNDRDVAVEMFKRMTDQRLDLTLEQKEQIKAIVELWNISDKSNLI